MYDLCKSNEWHESSKSGAGGVGTAEPIDTAVADDEETPKPFLNEYLPTPQEIRRVCEEIQREWTDYERRRRRGYRRANQQPYTLKTVRTVFSG